MILSSKRIGDNHDVFFGSIVSRIPRVDCVLSPRVIRWLFKRSYAAESCRAWSSIEYLAARGLSIATGDDINITDRRNRDRSQSHVWFRESSALSILTPPIIFMRRRMVSTNSKISLQCRLPTQPTLISLKVKRKQYKLVKQVASTRRIIISWNLAILKSRFVLLSRPVRQLLR